MSNHLSEDQFEACVLGRAGEAELQHLSTCAKCSEEFEGFGKALSLFRRAVWDLADDRAAVQSSNVMVRPVPSSVGIPKWHWVAVVTAFVGVVVIPILVTEMHPVAPQEQMGPEEVMERLNRHLARTLPAPMEPMMLLISNEPSTSDVGGIQ